MIVYMTFPLGGKVPPKEADEGFYRLQNPLFDPSSVKNQRFLPAICRGALAPGKRLLLIRCALQHPREKPLRPAGAVAPKGRHGEGMPSPYEEKRSFIIIKQQGKPGDHILAVLECQTHFVQQ